MITDAASGAALKAEAAASAAANEGQEPSLVRAPVKHVLSKELQLYFDRVARILRGKPGQPHYVHACVVHVLLQRVYLCVRRCAFVGNILQCLMYVRGHFSVLTYARCEQSAGFGQCMPNPPFNTVLLYTQCFH